MNCQLHTSNIQDKVRMHAAEILGNSFSFREGQLEAICKIVENSASGIKHTMLEAPTGSGKSIIALMSAYVLYKEFNMKSYILVSDLTLYKQYENDIKKTGSTFFGCIKGKENYICAKNGCKVSQSACSLQRMSVIHLMNLLLPYLLRQQSRTTVQLPLTLTAEALLQLRP